MILGVVSVQGLPTIILPIAGQDWPATIDTGFNGDLELPDALREPLNAQFVGRATAALAGGQNVEEDLYLVDFPFDGRVVQAEATFVSGSRILIGTRLLREYSLQIDFVGGTVRLESARDRGAALLLMSTKFLKGRSPLVRKRVMRKRIFGFVLNAMLFALCFSASAQQPKKVPRIGYLAAGGAVSESTIFEAIRVALRELGYIEGQNIAIEYRYAEGKPDRYPELAAELVRLKVDIIVVAGGLVVVRAAKNVTKTIPIVMVGRGIDPVEAGVVESLARPGGNVTGLTNLSIELGGKQLELLKEAVPKLARVAVLYDPANRGNVLRVKEVLPVAARALKLTVQPWEVRAADDFEKVFAALTKKRPDALYVPPGPLMNFNQKRIVDFALKSRLPSLHGNREAVNAGGLMYYGADQADSYRRVAYYVDKILKGSKPADLPVEQPTKFELVINLKTAKQIGVTIPQSLLYRADKVIK